MDEIRPEEEAAWAEVEARWEEAGAHQAYLARFSDLEGLATAGRRYKQALDREPGDAVAARGREDVLRRATALALAQLPRTRPPAQVSPGLRRALLVALAAAMAGAVAWILTRFPRTGALP
jgi:hypothetical protein